jgi:putative SOS response-associated peptidase YedK
MCGRYTLVAGGAAVAEFFALESVPTLTPRYNIAPSQTVAIVRTVAGDPVRKLAWVRWGLIPSWTNDITIANRLLNARSETVSTKPAFRAAFKQRRCLVPADGFFEWQAQGRRKQPYYFRRRDEKPFALAGLWERWQGADDTVIESCTLLTTEANALLRPIHDRMPVLLAADHFDHWLDPALTKPDSLLELLRPWPAEDMTAQAVQTLVNSPRNEGPACIAPVEQRGLFETAAPG